MKTKRTISNISYNTPAHFRDVIMSLEKRGVIDWAYWIMHEADVDEKKPHIHFVLSPSSAVDTAVLGKVFEELDPSNVKPLGVTKKWMYTSSMDDWLLYAVHHSGYLASKGQVRNIEYGYEDLEATDEDALANDWNNIDFAKYGRLSILADYARRRIPFGELVAQGLIPINQRAVYEAQYQYEYRKARHFEQTGDCGRVTAHEEDIPAGFEKLNDEDIEF